MSTQDATATEPQAVTIELTPEQLAAIKEQTQEQAQKPEKPFAKTEALPDASIEVDLAAQRKRGAR
jgi:hypothetical protein